jgi:hypothetical protein
MANSTLIVPSGSDPTELTPFPTGNGSGGARPSWIVSPIDKDAGDTLVDALPIFSKTVGHAYTIGVVVPGGTTLSMTTVNHRKTYVHSHQEALTAQN